MQGTFFEVTPFANFLEVVRRACGAHENWDPPRPITYLRSYLSGVPDRSAKTLVVESQYVDRHFLEEFTAYYATLLRPPAAYTTRIHVFAEALTDDDVSQHLHDAASGKLADVQEALSKQYLGFVTIRPMSCTPVGRTMVVHYGDVDHRCYAPVIRQCRARLLGIELTFDALPFIQQDQGVGACATAALWAALAKSCRDVGMRAPTPHAVTTAAIKNVVTDRPFPATSGLDMSQMAEAIRGHGFSPYTVKVGDEPELFLWTLMTYVRSGVPAVLFLNGRDGHAVAVAGFKESDAPMMSIGERPTVVQTHKMTRVYIHDDRIGPYVKASMAICEDSGYRRIQLTRIPVDDPRDTEYTRDTFVNYAIFPLYPKVRLSAPELVGIAGRVAPALGRLVGDNSGRLVASTWFAQNGAYLQNLFEVGAAPARVADFILRVRMSRYVGIIRWLLDDVLVADVVCDTTDIQREQRPYAAILGVFFATPEYGDAARSLLNELVPDAVVV